ncbi:apolipoprotein N-acyltransferase [Congregibacter sp.]|uniref:apolipoprotein N-acyltransferase n=1 Tax=Congregibacter sp. TaxID=2744308 RepID=UPI00385D9219
MSGTLSSSPSASALPRWQVLILAPLAGALLTLSLAPFDLWPTAIVGCAVYAYLLASCTPRQAIWRGWLFGLGLFGSGASWVYVSIHVYGNAGVILAAFLTLVFCAGLGLLHALQAWLYTRIVRPLPGGMLLGFAAFWVFGEWLRSWLLTGFPWLYLGYGHVDTWLAGWAPITGVYGLSFAVAFTASCVFLTWRSPQPATVLSYGGLLATLWGGGLMLKPIEWVAPASEKPLSVAIYQPNIPLEQKWDRTRYQNILRQYERAVSPMFAQDLVLWPESAIPRVADRAGEFLDPIARRASMSDTVLITGIPTRDTQDRYFNSIIALGQGKGQYDKQRLVPFGEYVPLEAQLRGLIDFFDLPMSNFSRGSSHQGPLEAGNHRVAPLICYEIVYPELVAQSAQQAELLITISNDSWFGASIGPLQHLQMARMRALENGRYLLRGTNNGVSAIIDHRGQLVARSEQFVESTLMGNAQVMLGNTPFTSFGSMPLLIALGLLLGSMSLMYRVLWRDADKEH